MNVFTWWMIRQDIISHISPDLLFNSRFSCFLQFVFVICVYLPKCRPYISIFNVCNRLPMSSLLEFSPNSTVLTYSLFFLTFSSICFHFLWFIYISCVSLPKMLTLHFLCWFPVKLLNVCVLLKLVLFISRKNYLYKNSILSDIWTFFEK